MTTASIHPALEPVAFLLGTWRGNGEGSYPSIDEFTYDEVSEFWHTGRPWLGYVQRTWAPDGGAPMHSEMGYLRPQRDETIEFVATHAFGIVELAEGRRDGNRLTLQSTRLESTASAKTVDGVTRVLEVTNDRLVYDIGMAFGGRELTPHLRAELVRDPS